MSTSRAGVGRGRAGGANYHRASPYENFGDDELDDLVDVGAHNPCLAAVSYPAYRALPRAHSMDLHNDPRFFTQNVIEKRLDAFTSLSVIAAVMTGTALAICLEFSELPANPLDWSIAVMGIFSSGVVLFQSLVATCVFIYQSFFTRRLMTAGATGFELAAHFYLNDEVVRWRHFAVSCLGYSLPLLLASTGCILYMAMIVGQKGVLVEGLVLHPLALATLLAFWLGALVLLSVAVRHNVLFAEEYSKRVHPDSITEPLMREVTPRRGP